MILQALPGTRSSKETQLLWVEIRLSSLSKRKCLVPGADLGLSGFDESSQFQPLERANLVKESRISGSRESSASKTRHLVRKRWNFLPRKIRRGCMQGNEASMPLQKHGKFVFVSNSRMLIPCNICSNCKNRVVQRWVNSSIPRS
ncbi:Uncharacterized protein TCM_034496 [Theobroma cacao]|uniref:Uncharacterized protein n=1 Tax=Theobroma cacao TaxID=3641 RepID=A0A061FDN1_THECC|nr:Uncharacterized protein TCM_034496 [Theobroma cacao]